jgi:hypothetical protein
MAAPGRVKIDMLTAAVAAAVKNMIAALAVIILAVLEFIKPLICNISVAKPTKLVAAKGIAHIRPVEKIGAFEIAPAATPAPKAAAPIIAVYPKALVGKYN